MKKYILIVCTFWVSALIPVMGQSFIFNGDTLKGSICMIDDNSQNDTMLIDADTWETAKDTTHGWYTRGDVAITDTLDSVVYFTSTGPGKGGVYFTYGTRGCGDFVKGSEIYKDFSPDKYELAIQGPDCLKEGDTAVYSVDPIFTKNLGDFIGIDNYYWNINQKPYPSFVDTIIYVSGDGSSITFVAGTVSGKDSIVVNFGRCNQDEAKRIVKYVWQAAPLPEVPDTVCFKLGVDTQRIDVANAQENIYYMWDYVSSWDIEYLTDNHSSVNIIAKGTGAYEISVSSSFTDGGGCEYTSRSIIGTKRSWANDAGVDTIRSDRFVIIGDTATLMIKDGLVPDNAKIKWDIPNGWDVPKGKTNTHNTLQVVVNNTMQLIDTFYVSSLSCNVGGIDKDSTMVYIKPAKVTEITDNGCLIVDTTYKFKITDWEVGPKATTYKWLVDGKEKEDYKGDSLVWKAESGAQTISVIPRGAMYDRVNYYWGDTATFTLAFQPTPPDSIYSLNTCLFANEEIATTLRIKTPIPGQTYHWSPIEGWDMSYDSQNPNDSSIVTYSTSNASSDNYPVSVYATGEGNCGVSILKKDTIKVKDIPYDIVFTDMGELHPMFEGNYGFSLNIDTDSAIWKVGTTNFGKRKSITLTYIPQEVIATVDIQGCEKDIKWPDNQINSNGGNLINRKKSLSEELPFSVFPNPVQSEAYLQIEDDKQYTLYIVDAKGTLVSTNSVNDSHSSINTSSLPNGDYFFILADKERKKVCPVIIQH